MRKIVLLNCLVVLLSTSCTSRIYYQVFETETSTEKIEKQSNALVYEDENCAISYDFWEEYGDLSFTIANKTDQPLFLDLEKSFFVLNGMANDYYQQRLFFNTSETISSIKSSSLAKSATGVNYASLLLTGMVSVQETTTSGISKSRTVASIEKPVVCIPAHTAKNISGFLIFQSRIRDCDLLLYPKVKEVSTLKFERDNSPVVFENRLVYRVGDGPEKFLTHSFFVSSITNMHKSKFIEKRTETFCGQEGLNDKEYFRDPAPDKFYISYEKGLENWKH